MKTHGAHIQRNLGAHCGRRSGERLADVARFEAWQRQPADRRPVTALRRRVPRVSARVQMPARPIGAVARERAPRVALPMSILYRRAHEARWLRATVLNLSESGVLFGPSDLQPGTPVEVLLSPPFPVAGFATGAQVCVGEVVRITGVGAVAARFDECRFLLES